MSIVADVRTVAVLLSRQLARLQARVGLAAIYFVLVPLLALVVRLVVDPLRLGRRHAAVSGWKARRAATTDPLSELRRQF